MKSMYENWSYPGWFLMTCRSWSIIWSVWLFKATKLQLGTSKIASKHRTFLSLFWGWCLTDTIFNSHLMWWWFTPKKWGMQRLLCVSTNWRDQIWQTNTENILCSNHFNDYIPTIHLHSHDQRKIDPSNRANIEQRKDDKSLGGHWSNMSSQ